MFKTIKKVLGLLLLLILLLMIAIPYFFKDEIVDKLKTELNSQLNATVDFGDVSINLFKDFPNFYVNIKDLNVQGKGEFEGTTLYQAPSTAVTVDLKSVMDGSYKVKAITLDNPTINVKVTKAGKPNYDIYTPTEPSTSTSSTDSKYQVALQDFTIKNGSLLYDDIYGDIYLRTTGLNHSGSGDFTQDVFDYKSNNAIESLTLRSAGIDYAKHWKLVGDVNIGVDSKNNIYSFKDNSLKINDLDLAYTGDIAFVGDALNINLDFDAPNNAFKSILSIIPAIYTEDFASLKATGNTNFNGKIHGTYHDGKSYPAVDINFAVDNGNIQYPDLPESIENLNTAFSLKGNNPKWTDLTLDVPKFAMQMAGEQITGKCHIDNVMGNPDISAILDGNFDLAVVDKFVEIDGLKSLSGKADTHLELDATYDDISNQNYASILFNSDIKASNVKVEYAEYPTISIAQSHMKGSPQNLSLEQTQMNLGASDMNVDFQMNNPLGYAIANQKVVAKLDLKSKNLNANEWLTTATTTTNTAASSEPAISDTSSDAFVENLDIDYTVNIANMEYEDYKLSNIVSAGRIDEQVTRIDKLNMKYDGIDLATSGTIKNAYRYAMYNEELDAQIDLRADKINANDFMTDTDPTSSASTQEMSVIPVPKGIKANINTTIGQLIYDNYTLTNVNGVINVADEVASIINMQGSTLGGNLKISGDYNTKDINNPLYKLSYDIERMDFKQVFQSSPSFKLLVPIAEFMDGKFNNKMSAEGKLGQDMMPDLTTLSADGFLETLNSVILNFPVLNEIGSTLGIKELKTIEVKDSRNWFTVKDGAIKVEEKAFSEADMNFKIGGTHFINGNIDYTLKAEIPRSKLEKSNITSVVNSGMDWLANQASAKGVNLSVGDFVYLDIKIGGTIKKPTIKIIPTGSGGQNLKDQATQQVKDQLNAAKEKAMTKAEEEVERRKQEALQKGQAELDKVKAKAEEKVDAEVDKAKEVVKDKVKDVVKTQVVDTLTNVVKDKVGDVLGDEAKQKVDDVKDKLKDINPFKKKKD